MFVFNQSVEICANLWIKPFEPSSTRGLVRDHTAIFDPQIFTDFHGFLIYAVVSLWLFLAGVLRKQQIRNDVERGRKLSPRSLAVGYGLNTSSTAWTAWVKTHPTGTGRLICRSTALRRRNPRFAHEGAFSWAVRILLLCKNFRQISDECP